MPHRSLVRVALAAALLALGCSDEAAVGTREQDADARDEGGQQGSDAAGGFRAADAGARSGVTGDAGRAGSRDASDRTVRRDGSVDASEAGGGSNVSSDAGGRGPAGSAPGSDGGTGGSSGPCRPPAPGSSGKNPLFVDQYTADPAPMVHDCTFYIACGHDEGDTGFVLREWFILSSTDMVNWTKSVAMRLSTFSWADANAWAGQLVEKDGKFYWYVPVNQRGSGMAIGVAVADSPLGPFKDAIGRPLVDDARELSNWNFNEPGQTPFTIDPSVFVDDDGQAYLHYGGFGRMVVAKLNADMVSIDGRLSEVTPRGFFEAPFLFKRGGRYYEVYAGGTNPASIDYATSASPMGPWTYGGRILDPLPTVSGQDGSTSHPGVAEFAGQWYLVYHLSNGPNNGGTYRREVAVDKLVFKADGSIEKLTPSSGLRF